MTMKGLHSLRGRYTEFPAPPPPHRQNLPTRVAHLSQSMNWHWHIVTQRLWFPPGLTPGGVHSVGLGTCGRTRGPLCSITQSGFAAIKNPLLPLFYNPQHTGLPTPRSGSSLNPFFPLFSLVSELPEPIAWRLMKDFKKNIYRLFKHFYQKDDFAKHSAPS